MIGSHSLPSRPVRRWMLLCIAVLLAAPPIPAEAAVLIDNFMVSDVVPNPPRVEFYDYTSPTTQTWTSQADFAAGTSSAVSTGAVPGSVTLVPIGPSGVGLPDASSIPWWDKRWNTRNCYDIDHTAPGAQTVTEYQVRLTLDLGGLIGAGLLQADTGDLRAVAADGATQLDLWAEGPATSAQGVVWVQVDSIPSSANTHFCLYYGFNAGVAAPLPNHTEAAVFTHTTRKPIYYAVSGRHATNPASVPVVSYIAANQVQRDAGAPVALAAAGDRTTFNAGGTNAGSVFSVLGPISSRGDGNGYDTLSPISWAGTLFAVPTVRGTQRFSFYAPFANATVSIYNGGAGAPYATFVVPQGTQFTHNAGDITGSNSAVIQSTAPVLVSHVNTAGHDPIPVPPATTSDLYGVRSTRMRAGFTTNGTALTVQRSDGSTQNYNDNRGQTRNVGGGRNQGGAAADGFRLAATQPIGAMSQADSDGSDSAAFVPVEELNSEYWLPTNSQYVAFSCPDAGAGFTITITPPAGAPRNVVCVGPGLAQPDFPGWAKDTANLSVTGGRGIRVHSPGGEPFYAYYEHRSTNDETNVLGMKQGRQYTWPEPVLSATVEGLVSSPGTWESATFDTGAGTEIFGLVGWTATLPAATAVTFQVATSDVDPPAAFVGPDGTAASFFTSLPDAFASAHDGDRYVRVRAYLSTTDLCRTPQLDAVAIDYHLPHLAHPLNGPGSVAVTGTVGGTSRHFLIRVRTADPALAGSLAHLRYQSGASLGNIVGAGFTFEDAPAGFSSTQLTLAGGPPLPTTGPLEKFDAGAPHSIVLTEEMVAGGAQINLRWRVLWGGASSPFIDHDFNVVISS